MTRTSKPAAASPLTVAIVVGLCLAIQPAWPQVACGQLVADTPPRTPQEQQRMFHLPPGFEIQLVAAEPDIRKPMNLNFDDRGRLWATQSVEYPFPAKPDATPLDCVKVLEVAGGAGRAEKVTTFVDQLNIPIGVMPIRGGAIVYSIPNIYRCVDTDGDGQADTRDLLYSSFGYGDTHGMASSFTWGFDGWLYACHGFANTSEVKGGDGQTIKMQSGNTFRMRPDGSRVEQFTWGQVNPFGLCFDPLGNLYSADCHSRPVYQLLRGAYYPSFGKPHDGLGYGPEMCRHEHGSTGIAGVVYYAADHFPPEYRDTIFIGNPVTGRINHDRLRWHGSTPEAIEQPDFLRCDDPWFRPVDIKLGPDGALYVADFYNRIIGHYEVPLTHPGRDRERGRIWRIVYTGPDGTGRAVRPRADWTKATPEELILDLGHANLVVRTMATNQLVARKRPETVEHVRHVLRGTTNPFQRMHALWVLERLEELDTDALERAREDSDPRVRAHAMKVIAGRKPLAPADRGRAIIALADPDPFVQRAAAEALGNNPEPANLRPLLQLRDRIPPPDAQRLHTVRMALRDQLRTDDGIKLVTALSSDERAARHLADVLPGVPSPQAAEMLLKHLQSYREDRESTARYVRHVARHGDADGRRALLEVARRRAADDPADQLAFVRAMHDGLQGRGEQPDELLRGWAVELGRRLFDSNHAAPVGDAIELARSMKLNELEPAVVAVAAAKQTLEGQRSPALGALAAINAGRHVDLFSRILGDASEPLPLRQQVAGFLGGLNRPEVHAQLCERLRSAPEQLAVHIAAALASSRAGAEQLLAELAAGKASPRLLQHPLVAGRLDAAKPPDLKDRIAKLTEGLPAADAGLQKLIDERRAGFGRAKTDPARGAALFEKHCSACHVLAGRGAKVGPQLDGIGSRGLDRLLEDLLDPNRNVDQTFRASLIATKDGQILTGLVLSDEGDQLVLADSAGKPITVPKNTIEERTISKLSPMPANVAEIMSEQEFYDLLVHLLAQQKPLTDGSN